MEMVVRLWAFALDIGQKGLRWTMEDTSADE